MPKQPIDKDEITGGNKGKRPDFTCSCINSHAKKPEEYEIYFHVECKRLGRLDSGWPLNKNYVTKGIKRFLSKEHEYGKRAPSGMMLGYVVNMTLSEIQNQINTYLSKELPYVPIIDFELKKRPVNRTTQKFNRQEVEPSDFSLHHLWVDLRKNYQFEHQVISGPALTAIRRNFQ